MLHPAALLNETSVKSFKKAASFEFDIIQEFSFDLDDRQNNENSYWNWWAAEYPALIWLIGGFVASRVRLGLQNESRWSFIWAQ